MKTKMQELKKQLSDLDQHRRALIGELQETCAHPEVYHWEASYDDGSGHVWIKLICTECGKIAEIEHYGNGNGNGVKDFREPKTKTVKVPGWVFSLTVRGFSNRLGL